MRINYINVVLVRGDMRQNLSVVIPAYKEEHRIERCIRESLSFLRGHPAVGKFELLFVADVSGDKTIELIQKYQRQHKEIKLIVNPQREQKGGSVKVGMLHAKYDVLLFYDVDLSTPLDEITRALNDLKEYDVVIGSRALPESHVQKDFFKTVLSTGFSLLKWLVLGLPYKDTQCGFKMFRSSTRIIFEKQRLKSSAFDVELLFIARRLGFCVKEMPVTWVDSEGSNFNILHVVFSFFRELAKIRINGLKGYYN